MNQRTEASGMPQTVRPGPTSTGLGQAAAAEENAQVSARVILVGPLPPPFGGMANQTRQLAELLHQEGLEVERVANNAPYSPAWVGRIPVLRAVFRLWPYIARLVSACGRPGVMHVMANSGWSWHLFAAPAIAIGRLRGVPVVVNYRGGEAASFLAAQARFVLPVLRLASVLVVPSGFLQSVFARYGVEAQIVPNVVDLSLFSAPAEASGAPGDAPHVLVARNLEAIYDNATALRAFALLRERFPRARLTIAGDGPERQSLLNLAAELGVSDATVFTGRLDRHAMARLYATADLMINPSLVDNTPNSVLESWACGVPVVSTRVGGVPYLIAEGEDGVLVPAGDAAAMAKAAGDVLGDAGRWQALRDAGLKSAQRNTWPVVRERLMGLYQSLMTQSGAFPQTRQKPDIQRESTS